MIAPENDLGFVADEVGFTPEASPTALASQYKPSIPPGDAPPPSPWTSVYSGLDGLDARLTPQQQHWFGALDRNSPDPKEARAKAINQAYVNGDPENGLNPAQNNTEYIDRNWPAIKHAYAQKLGVTTNETLTDTAFYGLVAKKLQEPQEQHSKLSAFWEEINKPIVALPTAPKDAPDMPHLGLNNPAVMAGIYNGLKPILETAESPFGLATLETGTILKGLSETYPLAKAALAGMTGLFTGIMGYNTVKGAPEKLKVINDPNATSQEKIEAGTEMVADTAMTLLGAVGTAIESLPSNRVKPVLTEVQNKTPAEAAEIFREEAKTAPQSDFLMTAADELDKIAEHAPEIPKAEAAVEAPKPKGEPAAEPKPLPKSLIGIKNEAIDAELEKMGEAPATHGERTTFEKAMESASEKLKENPDAGRNLVEELSQKTRPLTGAEDALLLHEQNRLRLARDAAEKELIDAANSGDPEALSAAKIKVAQARDEFVKAAEVATKAGTANAQGLALRRMMIAEDYSLAAMERRRVVANEGKPLTPEQETEVRQLHQKLQETQRAFEEYRAAQARGEPVAPRRAPPPSKVRAYLSDQAKAARERIQQRMREGRVQAGIDPIDLADHVIVGADYIARGVSKFADWSKEMVKEFGETIRPHLEKIFEQAKEARKDASRLGAFKTRTSKATQELQRKLDTGDLSKPEPRKPIPLDKEALRLKAEHERVKKLVDLAEMRDQLKNRTLPQKVQDAFVQWVRIGALSYPTVLAKLTGAAIIRGVSTPIEQAVGLGVSKLLPKLAAKAPREGVPSAAIAVKAEARAIVEGITTGMRGSWDMLRNRDSQESLLLEKTHLPPTLADWLGKLHGALKNPTKMSEFGRSLYLRTEQAIKNRIDPKDPVVQMRLMHEAWMDANRAIFMQDNVVVDAYRRGLNALEHINADKYDAKTRAAAQFLATGLKTELPIVKVPTNVIAEASQILTGWLTGPARAAFAYAKGLEGLKPAEADAIMRDMKKGSIGLAIAALGFFKAKQLGGFYQPGEKRKKTDVPEMGVRVGDVDVPKQLTHSPYFEIMQFGATMRRVMDSKMKRSGTDSVGIGTGLLAASLGLVEDTPFLRETSTLAKYADSRQFTATLENKAASILIPGAVQWLAAQMDKKTPFNFLEDPIKRKPTNFEERLKKGIPGLREEVPSKERNPRTSYRQ